MNRIGGGVTIVMRVFAAGGKGMRNRFLLGAGVALAVTLSGAAGAQAQFLSAPGEPGAFYVGGEGGWSWLQNADARSRGVTVKEHFKGGPAAGLRAGYEWGPLRIEEEFAYRINDMKSFGGIPVNGDRRSYAFMTNGIYDFGGLFGLPFTPHIGAGVGAVRLREGFSVPAAVPAAGLAAGTVASSSTWELGYQGIAGIRYNINPSLAFDVDYRYFATMDPTFHTTPAQGGVSYKSEHASHNVLASFTVKFGAPPPPPVVAPPAPPAPPPVQRKVFLVFFDWDKYTITPEGMQILQQAAAAYRSGAPVQIQVTGYTDRSGSPGYNQRLSERRAGAVATALEGLGVPRSQMIVSGRGENDNRVPTADGVREPQNRRVEIVFQ
jgi:outer membrane protein OmpA-like peptidoglycan-associated protein